MQSNEKYVKVLAHYAELQGKSVKFIWFLVWYLPLVIARPSPVVVMCFVMRWTIDQCKATVTIAFMLT